jgi:hypothetical protein
VRSISNAMLAMATAAVLAACSSNASPIITGSVFGGGNQPAMTEVGSDVGMKVKAEDPAAKPIQVAWTSARAAKCGFYFDPAKLRSAYLATDPAAQQAYDAAHAQVIKALASKEDYCSKETIADIRADLRRHLAGDYAPTLRVAQKESNGVLDFLQGHSSGEKKMDRNDIFFPSGGAVTATPR